MVFFFSSKTVHLTTLKFFKAHLLLLPQWKKTQSPWICKYLLFKNISFFFFLTAWYEISPTSLKKKSILGCTRPGGVRFSTSCLCESHNRWWLDSRPVVMLNWDLRWAQRNFHTLQRHQRCTYITLDSKSQTFKWHRLDLPQAQTAFFFVHLTPGRKYSNSLKQYTPIYTPLGHF